NWFIHLQKAFEIAPQKTVFVTMWLLRHARERLLQNRNWDFWGAFLRMTAQHAESLQNIAVSDSLYLYVLEELIIQTYGVDLNDAPPEIKGGLQKILEL
ncbi:MAG: hypothetical protein LBM70_02240, partial [Victivallales bacterium]|nr:hypothetical protein [Victivallales bacterium]